MQAYEVLDLFVEAHPSQCIRKENPLTQLTFLNLIRLMGGVYAEIKQAHIVLLFFKYFGDLLSLIIIGVVCGGVVSKSQIHLCVNTHKDKSKQLEQNKKRTRRTSSDIPRLEPNCSIYATLKFFLPFWCKESIYQKDPIKKPHRNDRAFLCKINCSLFQ